MADMTPETARRVGTMATAALFLDLPAATQIDTLLIPCPECHRRELRAEAVVQWLPIEQAAAGMDVSPDDVRNSGALRDGFGRVRCAVPYATCMACGERFNMNERRLG